MTNRTRLLLPLAALLVALVSPAASHAATVTSYVETPPPCSKYCGGDDYPYTIVKYDAAVGEANDVTWRDDGSTFTVHDEGARLSPSNGCTRVDDHTATCTLPANAPAATPSISLGDGNDRFTDVTSARTPDVQGGLGNDDLRGSDAPGNPVALHGGLGDDTLTDGPSASLLEGGRGADTLKGGAGDDTLQDGEPDGANSADHYDGGEGSDTVSYAISPPRYVDSDHPRTQGVTVDLAAGTAGAPGEGDTLTSIENARGTPVADVLLGDAGANTLIGAEGDDRIEGGPGDDTLEPSPGTDSVQGGAGNDLIDLVTGYGPGVPVAADVTCDDGDDAVAPTNNEFFFPDDCEHIQATTLAGETVRYEPRPVAVGRRAMAFSVPCPSTRPACATSVTVRVPDSTASSSGKTIAFVTSKRRTPGNNVMRARIQRFGRRWLAKHPDAKVSVLVSYRRGDPRAGIRHLIRLSTGA